MGLKDESAPYHPLVLTILLLIVLSLICRLITFISRPNKLDIRVSRYSLQGSLESLMLSVCTEMHCLNGNDYGGVVLSDDESSGCIPASSDSGLPADQTPLSPGLND